MASEIRRQAVREHPFSISGPVLFQLPFTPRSPLMYRSVTDGANESCERRIPGVFQKTLMFVTVDIERSRQAIGFKTRV